MSRLGGLVVALWLGVVTFSGAFPWEGFMTLSLSPDGKFLATGGRTGEVLWFDAASGEVLERWHVSDLPVVGLVFPPRGLGLAGVTLDGTTFWLVRGTDPAPLPPGVEGIQGLSTAPTRWIATPPPSVGVRISSGGLWVQGSPDGQITVGSVADGAVVATWRAQEAAVTGLALGPDGSFLVSGGYDGTLARWDPRTGRPLGHL